ncbi:Fic family protein [Halpernia frigidisoli]|uniref:Fic/DOC family protein n=1 Tax=Halpernia frigidisoli TaxID=1125876 RepID=A0A1I3DBS7_9FLAO|nr:Fic family protein [Halpernia frigidisoli]SFH84175.1 Fic/DOC family protein [Halpernia frigidisoli]
MKFKILNSANLEEFKNSVNFDLMERIEKFEQREISFDYFKTNHAISSVFSSKIEGEEIELDSFFKHKFLNIDFLPDYTKRADDLFDAYEWMQNNVLNYKNFLKSHKILSKNLLPISQQGKIRQNQMFIINNNGQIEYVATDKSLVQSEIEKFFDDVKILLSQALDIKEIFYFSSQIHLIFVKIHPFNDGNGRSGRLLEKWFLKEFLGRKAFSIALERNYYQNLDPYYFNLKKIGLEYTELDYSKSLDFLLMTVNSLQND